MEIITKDFRYMKIIFDVIEDCNNSMHRINMLAFPENEYTSIFAFDYFYPVLNAEHDLFEDGWDIYRYPVKEFERQGIDFTSSNCKFKFFFNNNYLVCQTYPYTHVVPAKMKETDIIACANFRTKHRFPSLSYYDRENGVSIWRSS